MNTPPPPDSAAIPAAPPPERRRPLPSAAPKPPEDDPAVAERLAAILASPSTIEADRDVAFLDRDETRGVRLQLDFLKAETFLRRRGIEHTVVVFGSTRIPEPAAAMRQVEALRAEVAAPGLPAERLHEARVELHRAERILAKSGYYEVARELGRRLGQQGRLTVVTGGGPGIMEAANRGAFEAGAHSVGLNITLPKEQFPNPYVTPELCFSFHYFAIRKLHFLLRAKALVAFPGGYGTLDELFETLALVQTRKMRPIPVVLVGQAFWRGAFDVDFLVDEGVIDPEDRDLFFYAETAEEICAGIDCWHRDLDAWAAPTTERPFPP